jgi:hypothetical protein
VSNTPILSKKATTDVRKMFRKKLELEPELVASFKVEAEIIKDHLMKATISSPLAGVSYTIFADEPPLGGGHGSAPFMFGYFMAGALLCELAQYTWNAAELDLVDSITKIELTLDGSFPAGPLFGMDDTPGKSALTQMRVVTRIQADAPPEKIEKLARLAAERCPAHQSFVMKVPYFNTVELNGKKIAEFGHT